MAPPPADAAPAVDTTEPAVIELLSNVTRVYRRKGSRCDAWSVVFARTETDIEIELHRPRPEHRDRAGRRLRKVSCDHFWYRDGVLVVSDVHGFHLQRWDDRRGGWAPFEYEGGVGCSSPTYPVSVTAEGLVAGPERWFVDEASCERGERLAMVPPCRP